MLATTAYRLSKTLPASERYGLVSQITRAAISVPANIAEGYMRGTRKDYAHFVSIARGSCAELETLLILSMEVEALSRELGQPALEQAEEVARMLTALRLKLEQPKPRP